MCSLGGRLAYGLVLAACLLFGCMLPARADDSPDHALQQLIADARSKAAKPAACNAPDSDDLVRIFCTGRIQIGVREDYPLFGSQTDGQWHGYEIAIARAVADRLGVALRFVPVKPATRIAMLADGSIDLAIAAIGDNTQRAGQVRFIHPHYYRSQTVLVGPQRLALSGWADVRSRTICATVGNGSNAELVGHDARLMLFDDADSLPQRLEDQTCTLAAQDNSFFASYLRRPEFAARFSEKFGFAPVPWGMAVTRQGSDLLARVLDAISQIFHRDGIFLAAARDNGIATAFLVDAQQVWSQPPCNAIGGPTDPECVLPSANAELQPTPFADAVAGFETVLFRLAGIRLQLPMLKTVPAWSLFLSGVVNSLILIGGALAATLVFALGFGAAMGAPWRTLRWPVRVITVALQSSPILLTLVITAALVHAVVAYSSSTALVAAVVALGLANGSNAGQAIAEALLTLRTEYAATPVPTLTVWSQTLSRSATQIVAFLINAAKGTPIASFIGAPELLNALTDITSFSDGRTTTYTLLLVFYTAVVIAVVGLCRRFQSVIERSQAATWAR
jgi:ABC-type amino acid transport substrate-binding protein/ABC-type amino acid transport system permease subunit